MIEFTDLVFAFNAFPFRTTGVEDWLRKRIAQEQPTNPWGAFRLAHNPGTREESRRLAALLPPPRPDDEYNRFRVEETNRPEADMPREYMTSLMWNPGSDIDLAYGAGGATALDAPRSASALRSDPAFIRAIDRSAVELINDPRIVRHFLQEVDWSQQQFKGRGPNTVESESLFNEMSMVVPERRVPFGIHYHDVDSVVQAVPHGDGAKLFPEALEAFVRMRDAARSDGVRLSIGSAWRSVERQRAAAARNPNPAAVAPGISAHNYGLAVDLFLSVQGLKITEISTYSMLNMLAMYRSPIYKWLAANAAGHGWFPYRREPWHWEYNPPGFKERFEGAAAVAQAAGEVVGDIDPRLYESSDFLGKIRILGDWLAHRTRFTFGVQNTTIFPHSAICHIRIQTASGPGGAGTGFQDLVEQWVLGMNLTKTQFLLLSQFIIFILGWPLEWTEIIVIFMPIFIPLLAKFNIDPLFFGLLVALNLQTAFLSPPVAMAAFYLKGVSPPHVTLNAIFAGMMPFMAIQVIALVLLYIFPAIGLWLPQVLYK